jgi:hypothetical protein
VLSEILRDVDLFVGVGSVGNDPSWQDGGPEGRFRTYWQTYSFGELSETAKTRRSVLQRLIPRLIGGRFGPPLESADTPCLPAGSYRGGGVGLVARRLEARA